MLLIQLTNANNPGAVSQSTIDALNSFQSFFAGFTFNLIAVFAKSQSVANAYWDNTVSIGFKQIKASAPANMWYVSTLLLQAVGLGGHEVDNMMKVGTWTC